MRKGSEAPLSAYTNGSRASAVTDGYSHPVPATKSSDPQRMNGFSRIRGRYTMPIAGALLGFLVAILLSFPDGSRHEATAIMFLGQPFTPVGGTQIQSLSTNPRTVAEIVRSAAALQRASEASGIL